MPKAPNKLYSRHEIRQILRELRNDTSRLQVQHRDSYRKDPNHDESTCKFCLQWTGRVDALGSAIRYFGGYRG